MNWFKETLRPSYRKIKWAFYNARGLIPNLPVQRHTFPLKRLGSAYGGWVFVDAATLYGATIVSCGAGEDISFDIEFATHYSANILIVDPTPRAIEHFFNVKSCLTQRREVNLETTHANYDLSLIRPEQLMLSENALWNENKRLRFFSPVNPRHVSHSIVNFQNNYANDTDHIEVSAITLETLISTHNLLSLPILKLDIEGAEIEVLKDMLHKQIRPQQILVEYDELSAPSKRSRLRIESAHTALKAAGYMLVNREGSNFTYYLTHFPT